MGNLTHNAFNRSFRPDTYELIILQGVLNRWTFGKMAEICSQADPKPRKTSFIQWRLQRLIDNGYIAKDEDAKGTTGSYLLTQPAAEMMKQYNIIPQADAPIV